jgi:hypothetical protein
VLLVSLEAMVENLCPFPSLSLFLSLSLSLSQYHSYRSLLTGSRLAPEMVIHPSLSLYPSSAVGVDHPKRLLQHSFGYLLHSLPFSYLKIQ